MSKKILKFQTLFSETPFWQGHYGHAIHMYIQTIQRLNPTKLQFNQFLLYLNFDPWTHMNTFYGDFLSRYITRLYSYEQFSKLILEIIKLEMITSRTSFETCIIWNNSNNHLLPVSSFTKPENIHCFRDFWSRKWCPQSSTNIYYKLQFYEIVWFLSFVWLIENKNLDKFAMIFNFKTNQRNRKIHCSSEHWTETAEVNNNKKLKMADQGEICLRS